MRAWQIVSALFADKVPEPQKLARKPRAKRIQADHKPCATCGRTVAHTKDGRAYLHRCERKAEKA